MIDPTDHGYKTDRALLLDALDAAEKERDIPRHLRLALAGVQRALEARDLSCLGSVNEDLQGLVDAALGWVAKAEKERDELRATLAAERGDWAGGLPGWELGDRHSWVRRLGAIEVIVATTPTAEPCWLLWGWTWSVRDNGPGYSRLLAMGKSPCARDAMRTADAALAGLPKEEP